MARFDIPVLITDRLVLRAPSAADFPALRALHADPEVMRHLGTGAERGTVRGPAETWDMLQRILGQWALRHYGLWIVEERSTGSAIGRAGLLHPYEWPEPEIAYALARAWWSRGLATEAAAAIRDWGFATLDCTHFASFIAPGNVASRRVAEKLGGILEGSIALENTLYERWVHYRPGRGPIV